MQIHTVVIKYGVPQGSILGPLNLLINDIFYFTRNTKIANYADDNTPRTIGDSIDNLLKTLENETSVLLQWFQLNEMKSNEDKCHLLVANNTEVPVILRNENILAISLVKRLGETIDNNLNFT